MKQTFKTTGRLIYDPPREGMKKTHRAEKGWLILRVDDELARYYRAWVRQHTGWILDGNAFGAHVTVINDRDRNVSNHAAWKKYHNKVIEIEVSVVMEQHWQFFVLPVVSKELNEVRTELGLGAKSRPLHITIGRMKWLEEKANHATASSK